MNNYFNFEQPEELDCRLVLIENDAVTIMLFPAPQPCIEFTSAIYVDVDIGWKGAYFALGSRDDLAEIIEAGILDEAALSECKIFKIMPVKPAAATYYIVAKDAVLLKRPRTKRLLHL